MLCVWQTRRVCARDDGLIQGTRSMNSTDSQTPARMTAVQDSPVGGGGRWWLAVGSGVAVSLPLGWLLSYGASLPFMLGLFFFALFGLVIGAVVYRVGLAARPVPSMQIRLGTAVVIIMCFGISLAKEARDYPIDMADYVSRTVQLLPDDMTSDDLKTDVVAFIQSTLRERYGSDGTIGYVRWALASGRLEYPVATMTDSLVLTPAQNRFWWIFRVLASAVLLTFGIYSQTALLGKPPDAPPPVGEAELQ